MYRALIVLSLMAGFLVGYVVGKLHGWSDGWEDCNLWHEFKQTKEG